MIGQHCSPLVGDTDKSPRWHNKQSCLTQVAFGPMDTVIEDPLTAWQHLGNILIRELEMLAQFR